VRCGFHELCDLFIRRVCDPLPTFVDYLGESIVVNESEVFFDGLSDDC
jgi:hypothetical protein